MNVPDTSPVQNRAELYLDGIPPMTNAEPFEYEGVRRSCMSIGARGFEPRTSCSRSRRANRAALRPVCRRARNVMCPPSFGSPGAAGAEP